MNKLLEAYTVIVDHLRSNTKDAALLSNFEGTEARCVKALLETCRSDENIALALSDILNKSFNVDRGDTDTNGGMITQGPIAINSFCPHHLYPVRYSAYVSYLPKDNKVVGLSKLARICKVLGERPVLHEQLANDICNVLCGNSSGTFPSIDSNGSAVMLVGVHTCMAFRGVHEDARTSVVELRGGFWKSDMENKFYQAVNSIKTASIV